jgi:hypothetical protein
LGETKLSVTSDPSKADLFPSINYCQNKDMQGIAGENNARSSFANLI